MQKADARHVKRVLIIQALLVFVAVAFALPFGGPVAVSALIGSGACLLANALFAVWVFRSYRAAHPEHLLIRIYVAELAKLGLLLGLFAIAFVTADELNIPALLGSYLITQIASSLLAAPAGDRPRATSAKRR